MKQRAKVYKGKRVVMGDKNRVTKHEIHVNDIPQQGGESGGSNSGNGGGSELEGEYFLAKPNGRYWKSKLARMERGKYPSVMELKSNFTEAQLESLVVCAEIFAYCAFSAIGDRGGIPSSGYEVFYESPNRVAARCATDVNSIYSTDDRVALLGAWQECGFTMLIPGMESVYVKNGLVDFMRLTAEGELDGVSDDEVLAMASEMLMIEQVTKEEYESWYKWDE